LLDNKKNRETVYSFVYCVALMVVDDLPKWFAVYPCLAYFVFLMREN